MNLTNLLKLLPIVGPAVAQAEGFVEWWNQVSAMLNPVDQATAKAALADLQADNDEGHARLQAKLTAAAKT